MKSIFLGNSGTIQRVYTTSVRKALKLEAGLDDSSANFDDTRFIFSTWGMPSMTIEEIKKKFPQLEAVFYAAGSVQHFARSFLECNVRVFSAWAANGIPVAEFAFAQILLANKNFYACARFASVGDTRSMEKAKKTIIGNYNCRVGIIGAGMIGRQVIDLLQRHNLEVLVFDPFLSDAQATELKVRKVSLEVLFEECQTISNHLANNPQTIGILNEALFSSMRDGAVFINTGRGAQVVEDDLCRVLTNRQDLTAVLDVTWPEPPIIGHDFYSLSNVVLTPHIAGSMGNEIERMSLCMLEEFRRLIKGEPCCYEVTEEMLSTMA